MTPICQLLVVAMLATWAFDPVPAAAQASPYVPLEHRLLPFFEHLVRSGAVADPLPLTRPIRRTDLKRAIAGIDTVPMPAAARGTLRRLHREFGERPAEAHGRAEVYAGGALGNYARRDVLRQEGTDIAAPRAGVVLEGVWGSLVASTHQLADERLQDDPDYRGRKGRWTVGRGTDAYVGLQGRFGEVVFGSLSRNWGPAGIPGTVLSPEPYSYDHLYLRIGTPRLRLEAITTELDAMDLGGERVRRFWTASRLVASPTLWFTGSVSQASLWSGAGRGSEPWWMNPLKASATTQMDETDTTAVNSMYAATARVMLPNGVAVQGDLLVDDLSSILSSSVAPDRIAATVVADIPISAGASARLLYTMVTSLTYRSSQGLDQAVMRRGVGLGRNWADYDQLSAEISLLPSSRLLITPRLDWLRQGEGDFRLPFPPLPATDHPLLFEGTVERTLRVGTASVVTLGERLSLSGDVGVHVVWNAGHVAARTASVFVWRVMGSYHVAFRGSLPQ